MPDIHFPRNSVSGNSLKNSLITGTLLLTLAGVLTRIIGFFYRIFLSRLIGAEGLGIYQLLSPVMALGFAVTAAGIQTAISRFVSSELAQNNPAGARLYFRIGLLLSLFLSAATGFVIWKYADFIGVSMLGDVRCIPLLKIISLSFIPGAVFTPASTAATMDRKRRASPLSHSSQSRSPASARSGCSIRSICGSRPPFRSPSQCGAL